MYEEELKTFLIEKGFNEELVKKGILKLKNHKIIQEKITIFFPNQKVLILLSRFIKFIFLKNEKKRKNMLKIKNNNNKKKL